MNFFTRRKQQAAATVASARERYGQLVQNLAATEDLTPAEAMELDAVAAKLATDDTLIEADAALIQRLVALKQQAATQQAHRAAAIEARTKANAYEKETERMIEDREREHRRLYSAALNASSAATDAQAAAQEAEDLIRQHAARLGLPPFQNPIAHLFDTKDEFPTAPGAVAFSLEHLEATGASVADARFRFDAWDLQPAPGQTPEQLAANIGRLKTFNGDQDRARRARDDRENAAANVRQRQQQDAERAGRPRSAASPAWATTMPG